MTTEPTEPTVLDCVDVVQEFKVKGRRPFRRATVSAVAGVSFTIARGETFALVGETGSGKSTLARTVIGAPGPVSGRVTVSGRTVGRRRRPERDGRRTGGVQMVFQDPFSALDPRWTVERSVTEPLVTAGVRSVPERRRRVAEILHLVGLGASRFAGRRPRELSGGQAQRVAIARALVSRPDLVILDEPVTALDVSVQAQVLNLLFELKRRLSLTCLLIAHDLAVVRTLADRTGIMYLGRLCETAPTDELFANPAHPYTAALLSAIPPALDAETVRERIPVVGEQPSPLSPPSGCRYRTRCVYAQPTCAESVPELREIAPGHRVACHFPLTGAPSAGAPSAAAPAGSASPAGSAPAVPAGQGSVPTHRTVAGEQG
ncbi:ABC transporter ATP-binding protein [Plantactinospora sp. CA-294935]|uniref:ABC transporter ATP-binding protein n=1 Tax=Plantactinospora sp. CA-294935 TaxID=3240012 RepID=UPI003D8B0E21